MLAFVFALMIMFFGAVGLIAPGCSVWVARHAGTSGVFYVIAAIRVAFGLALISVASVSRAPRTLRVMGWIVLLAGIITAVTGLVAIERARAMIEWWLQQGSGIVRLTSVMIMAFGGFIACACAPRATCSTDAPV